MPSQAAQDEFDALFADKDYHSLPHPEDRDARSDHDDSDKDALPEHFYEKDDEDDEPEASNSDMRANYYLPQRRGEMNTGPKGVIADAHAFEQAKRARRFSLFRGKDNAQMGYSVSVYTDDKDKGSEDDAEEGFMQRWRQARLRELQGAGRRIRSRTSSPGKRVYGSLVNVDGDGFLDAIEKSASDTVVVVFIYDDMSDISSMVEDCVRRLAKQHSSTRFVKLHCDDAEMERAGVPAILAYRGGDKFAGLVPVMDEIPDDAELSAMSLEVALKKHQILF
ncbi:thioredoxin-like protein [Mytilinidion resinicola]|uniref:Thioredoxin-like protein n=1 Tax=Mytilinidion resinicola TaxID=574789 RepID=A0A6A6YCJ2_9PEZI|nr:thioredoxin-like protein [Mytilinidion resinicola]KAF2806531.1 thioredoxin-like protein [Mytilinidion resinicola]